MINSWFSYLLFVISFSILFYSYYYLLVIEKCGCFNLNKDMFVDVSFMKFYELLEICVLTLYFIFYIYKKPYFDKYILTNNIVLFILLVLNIYMSKNVYNFYYNIQNNCSCMSNKYKYWIYFEGFTSFISSLRILSLFIILMFILLTNE